MNDGPSEAEGGELEIPDECEARSCDKPPAYELAYTETRGAAKTRWYCGSHKNMEKIHDPVNINIRTSPSDYSDWP